MTPNKLQPGDEIRIVALARSASDIDETVLRRATMALESLGLTVTFSENAFSRSQRGCPSDQEKVDDLHAAFTDSKVKAILAAIGGFNSNQLLDKIDCKLIGANPKIFAGFSDITVLNHAILAKAGLIMLRRTFIALVYCRKIAIRWNILSAVCLRISRMSTKLHRRRTFTIILGITMKNPRAPLCQTLVQ